MKYIGKYLGGEILLTRECIYITIITPLLISVDGDLKHKAQ